MTLSFFRLRSLLVALFLVVATPWSMADSYEAEAEGESLLTDTISKYPDVDYRLKSFNAQLIQLQKQLTADPHGDKLPAMETRLQMVDISYNAYSQSEQATIAEDPVLALDVTLYQQTRQQLTDTLAQRHQYIDGMEAIRQAVAFMEEHKEDYDRLDRSAFKLSLTPKTATLLQKLKAKEQVLFGQVQSHFDAAQQAAQACPELNEQLEAALDGYTDLKVYSERIQTAEYKPLVTRLKDYLISFAAVAILLMFVSMLVNMIKAFKQQREAARKYQEMLNKQNDDTPSI